MTSGAHNHGNTCFTLSMSENRSSGCDSEKQPETSEKQTRSQTRGQVLPVTPHHVQELQELSATCSLLCEAHPASHESHTLLSLQVRVSPPESPPTPAPSYKHEVSSQLNASLLFDSEHLSEKHTWRSPVTALWVELMVPTDGTPFTENVTAGSSRGRMWSTGY